jgi:nucleoid-associated protein YgaU
MTTLTTLPAPPLRPAAAAVRVLRPGVTGYRSTTPRLVSRPRSCEGSAAPDLHGSRLTARGRVVVAVAWLALAVLATAPFLRLGDRQSDQRIERPTVTTTVVVEPGDTLWALAREVDAAADPRTVIGTIIELNGLRSAADIHPGDRLVVPASR